MRWRSARARDFAYRRRVLALRFGRPPVETVTVAG